MLERYNACNSSCCMILKHVVLHVSKVCGHNIPAHVVTSNQLVPQGHGLVIAQTAENRGIQHKDGRTPTGGSWYDMCLVNI